VSSQAQDQQTLLQAIESLRADIARLSDRLAALEGSNRQSFAAVGSSPNKDDAYGVPVTDEALICVIGAAVAAYLGVQPRIRQIRLVGGASWAQQGRVTIQASHALSIRHG
jgi:methylmalonyl-CoA carboxyltransferase large subunit